MNRAFAAGVAAAVLGTAGVLVLAQAPPVFGSLTELPSHQGTLEWRGTGDAGGTIIIRYTYRGFYAWQAPFVTEMLSKGMPVADTMADTLTLFPMETRVTVSVKASGSSSFEQPGRRTDCWMDSHSVSADWTERAPAREQMEAVLLHHAPPPPGFVLPEHFDVADRRKVGGRAELKSFQLTSDFGGPGISTQATWVDYDSPGNVEDTRSAAGSMSYVLELGKPSRLRTEAYMGYTGRGAPTISLDYDIPGPIDLGQDFDMASPKLVGMASGSTGPGGGLKKCSYLNTDESFRFDVKWDLSLRQQIDATIEPTMANEAEWVPEYNQIREYRITLKNPGPEGVGRLRVSLLDTSAHPGIATNARNHNMQAPFCADCTRAVGHKSHSDSQSFHGIPVTRHYHGMNECPIDDLPDMYFTGAENAGFTLVDPVTADLKQPISQVIELADTTEETYLVSVNVKDSGASAQLIAEAEMGGSWVPVKAIGPTADPLGVALLLPFDQDRDGMSDIWESRHRAFDITGDVENIPGAVNTGDGLTNFEEYRGVYALGQFVRPDPEQKTIFVHDYTGRRLTAIGNMRDFYAPRGLQVLTVDGSEFFEDVVNYQATDAKRGHQYIAVLMENPATPAGVGWRAFGDDWLTFAGMASHIGPPQRGLNTMALQYRIETRASEPWQIIGHELGHLMNVAHHGDADGRIVLTEATSSGIPAGSQLVAIKGGQHSGDFNCIMKYEAARLFCTLPRTVPYTSLFYDDYPLQTSRTTLSLCMSKTGTGTNASGAWAGDATRGNCTAQVKVRSY
jgi:hypothetical protein